MMRQVSLAVAILGLLAGGCVGKRESGAVLVRRMERRRAPLKELEGPGTRLIWDTKVVGGKVKGLYALGDVMCVHTTNEKVIVFDAAGGTELWRADLPGKLQFSPGRHKELMYVTVSDTVYAVDARSGAELWWRSAGTPLGAPPAVAADRVLTGNEIGSFTVLYVHGRKLAWSDPHWEVSEKPTVSGARVYVAATDGVLRAVDLESGEVEWEFATGSGHATEPDLTPGGVVFGTREGGVYLIREDGEQTWLTVLDRPVKRVRVVGEVVAAMVEPEGIVPLRVETGEELVTVREARKAAGASNDMICLLAEDELVGIKAVDGEEAWRMALGKFIAVAENSESDVVYAATRDGRLAALKLR